MSTNTPDQPSAYLIDTSTIISSFQYYAALNPDFHAWVKKQFTSGLWILHQKVYKECQGGKERAIANKYTFLEEINSQQKDAQEELPPDYKWIQDNCVNPNYPQEFTQDQYEGTIKKELERHADLHLIITAKESNGTLGIITEESRGRTGKLFKKIPVIADSAGIRCINLPEFLAENSTTLSFRNLP